MQDWARQKETKEYQQQLEKLAQEVAQASLRSALPELPADQVAMLACYHKGKYDALQEEINKLGEMRGETEDE